MPFSLTLANVDITIKIQKSRLPFRATLAVIAGHVRVARARASTDHSTHSLATGRGSHMFAVLSNESHRWRWALVALVVLAVGSTVVGWRYLTEPGSPTGSVDPNEASKKEP